MDGKTQVPSSRQAQGLGCLSPPRHQRRRLTSFTAPFCSGGALYWSGYDRPADLLHGPTACQVDGLPLPGEVSTIWMPSTLLGFWAEA